MLAVITQLNRNTWEEASTLCGFTKPTNITDYFQSIGSGWLSTPEGDWGPCSQVRPRVQTIRKIRGDKERSKVKPRSQTAAWGQLQ